MGFIKQVTTGTYSVFSQNRAREGGRKVDQEVSKQALLGLHIFFDVIWEVDPTSQFFKVQRSQRPKARNWKPLWIAFALPSATNEIAAATMQLN